MITYPEFQQVRVASLCREPRCPGDHTYTDHDFVRGLFDLICTANPRSVIEVGSYRGVSTELFLLLCQRVVAIDPWDYPEGIQKEFMERCGAYPGLEYIKGKSPEVLERYGNEFDMCYIDGLHETDAVISDIYACHRVVKPWGYLAGHDFHMPHIEKAVLSLVRDPRIFKDGSWLASNQAFRG